MTIKSNHYVSCDCCGWSAKGMDGEPIKWGSMKSALDAFQAYDGVIDELDLCPKCWRISDDGESVHPHESYPCNEGATT